MDTPERAQDVYGDPRLKILEELWQTEGTYVNDLENVINVSSFFQKLNSQNIISVVPNSFARWIEE